MVAIMEQAVGEVFKMVARNPQAGGATSTTLPLAQTTTSTTAPVQSTTQPSSGNSPTSSPLLFFVALGFGVVFTNLWIIVGVKYCFRYNARNRALRNGEDVDQVNMENIPARPHRRRKEKKLMTMDEVNERFPLTKYKNWVVNRMNAGLPTAGGVTAPPSRAGSVRNVEGTMPSSPVDTKHSVNNTRPATATSEVEVAPAVTPAAKPAEVKTEQKTVEPAVVKDKTPLSPTTATTPEDTTVPVGKRLTSTSMDDDDDEDDHIHMAVPPELLTNPGDSCAICIDTLEDDDDIRGLTCGHAFHAGCLDPWLTSRRACCPLCKADYFTPKPRPEGEQIDLTDRAARRREARMSQPQEPRTGWTGFRGVVGNVLSSRRYDHRAYQADPMQHPDEQRAARRERRAALEAHAQQPTVNTSAPSAPAPSRIRNPFSSMTMPRLGRNRAASQATTADPSPSQLEAGTTPAAR